MNIGPLTPWNISQGVRQNIGRAEQRSGQLNATAMAAKQLGEQERRLLSSNPGICVVERKTTDTGNRPTTALILQYSIPS